MTLILPLSGHHDRQGFNCGEEVLNNWLKQVAGQHKTKGISSTYVAIESKASEQILGFYSVNISEIAGGDLPPTWRKKFPEVVPCFRIGRLAVHKEFQGKQLGSLLLANALSRIRRVAYQVGGSFVVVDAKPNAVGFYKRYGFTQLADQPRSMLLPIWRKQGASS